MISHDLDGVRDRIFQAWLSFHALLSMIADLNFETEKLGNLLFVASSIS